MQVSERLRKIITELPKGVKLVAVSKTKPRDMILEVYNAGHKIFGENKVQEMTAKYDILPKDIEWHMVGHLQRNKVRFIAPFVSLIHSVDSIKLLEEINKEALKNHRKIPCLLQIKIAREESKYGLSVKEAEDLLSSVDFRSLSNVSIHGLMGMATYTGDVNIIRTEFRNLSSIFKSFREKFFSGVPEFKEISMGMSNDYKIAIEEGATILRVGSSIFGERIYY
jgi:hypothetical protein